MKLLKLLCTRSLHIASLKRLTHREDRNNVTKHTGLLLVTANEQSTAPGSTWGVTLTPGSDGLNHLNTFLDYLGDLDDMEDYIKTTLLNAKLGTF